MEETRVACGRQPGGAPHPANRAPSHETGLATGLWSTSTIVPSSVGGALRIPSDATRPPVPLRHHTSLHTFPLFFVTFVTVTVTASARTHARSDTVSPPTHRALTARTARTARQAPPALQHTTRTANLAPCPGSLTPPLPHLTHSLAVFLWLLTFWRRTTDRARSTPWPRSVSVRITNSAAAASRGRRILRRRGSDAHRRCCLSAAVEGRIQGVSRGQATSPGTSIETQGEASKPCRVASLPAVSAVSTQVTRAYR